MAFTEIERRTLSKIQDRLPFDRYEQVPELKTIHLAYEKLLQGDPTNPYFLTNVNTSEYINREIRYPLIQFLESKNIKTHPAQVYEKTFLLLYLLTYYWPVNAVNPHQPVEEGVVHKGDTRPEYLCPITGTIIAGTVAVGDPNNSTVAVLINGFLVSRTGLIDYWAQNEGRRTYPNNSETLTLREQEAIVGFEPPPPPFQAASDFIDNYVKERMTWIYLQALASVLTPVVLVAACFIAFPISLVSLPTPLLIAGAVIGVLTLSMIIGIAFEGIGKDKNQLKQAAQNLYDNDIGRPQVEYLLKQKTQAELPRFISEIDTERNRIYGKNIIEKTVELVTSSASLIYNLLIPSVDGNAQRLVNAIPPPQQLIPAPAHPAPRVLAAPSAPPIPIAMPVNGQENKLRRTGP